MLPLNLKSTYQQYKQDTNIVASWLATTALQSGYSAPLGQTNALNGSAPASGRLKGNARKNAKKKQAAASTSAAPATAKTKHIIAIKDFIPLAEHISGKVSAAVLAVPDFFSTALNRVIESRKRFSSLLGNFASFRDAIGDRQHNHFVSVLEKVRETFKSHVSLDTTDLNAALAASTEARSSAVETEADSEMRNMFESLRVYEPSESFLSAPNISPTTRVEAEYAVEELDPKIESLFVFSTLLADLFQLRKEIRDLWEEYKAGAKDLAAVSLATNTAIQLARSMEEEVAVLLDQLGGVEELLPMVFQGACDSRGLDPTRGRLPTDDLNYDCFPLADQFFFTAFRAVNGFKNAPLDASLYNGKFGWYNAAITAKDNRQQWQLDNCALLEVFGDLTLIFTTLKRVEVQDELTRGIKQMLETRKIPGIWVTFAAQVYLDILKTLGPDVRKGERDMRRITRSIAASVPDLSQASATTSGNLKAGIEEIKSAVKLWASEADIFGLMRMASGSAEREPSFLGHNPLFCGLHMHDVRVMFHRFGIEYASKPGNVMHTVQLYQALRQESILGESERRADLEFLMNMQGNSTFFVGKSPTTPEAYSKNFGLSKGISATHWIAGRKTKGKIPKSQAGIRVMKFKARASMAFGSTMMASSDARGLNADVVDQILERSGWYERNQGAEQPEVHEKTLGEGSSDPSAKKRQGPKGLSPVELVRQVSLAINNEVTDIMFDYFGIENTCREILKRVRESVDADHGGSISSGILRQIRPNDLSDIVGVIFSVVIGQGAASLSDSMALLREAATAFRGVPQAAIE